jgi:hypothetical protein
MLIGAYIDSIGAGASLHSTCSPAAKTLVGYAKAAAAWLQKRYSIHVQSYVGDGISLMAQMHPYIRELVAQQAAWPKLQEKKEPITYLIFKVMFDWVQSLLESDPTTFCDLLAVVFDWLCLGLHTGLYLGEYGQSKVPSGQLFATIPYSIDAGEWAGTPLAFIVSDFTFFDGTGM